MITVHIIDEITLGKLTGIRLVYPTSHIKVYQDGKVVKELKPQDNLPMYSKNTNTDRYRVILPDPY